MRFLGRSGVGFGVGGAFVVLAVLMVLPGGSALPSSLPGAHAPARVAPTALASESPGAAELIAASASLAQGAGPAAGGALSCQPLGSSVACSAGPATPHPAAASKMTWTDMAAQLSPSPSKRYLAMMTYDAADGYVLLFGGSGPSGVLADTWTFANGSWTDLNVIGPSARYLSAVAYDPVDHYVLLFGGYSGSVTYGDTWSFVSGSWSQVTSSVNSPASRWRANLAYDAADHYMLLFGGTDAGAATIYSDTWTFVNGTWTDITSNVTGSPPGRYRFAMTYDAHDGYVLIYGGCTATFCPNADTWKYVNSTWTDLSSSDGTPPAAVVYPQMTFDSTTGYVVLFGGASSPTGGTLYNNTWAFTGGKWYLENANVSKEASARGFEMLADVPAGHMVLLFGGGDGSSTYYGDTWALGAPVFGFLRARPAAVDIGLNLTLNATFFSNYQPLTYNFTGLPVGCTSADARQIVCHPTRAGAYEVNLTVNNSKAEYGNSSVNVSVSADPSIGSFTATRTTTTVGVSTILKVTVSGGIAPFAYLYTNLPPGCGSANLSTITCRPSGTGQYIVMVEATDAPGFTSFANLTLHVNPRPQVLSFAATPATIDANGTTVLVVSASGGTPPITYSYTGLPPGCASANVTHLVCVPSGAGQFTVGVNVTDGAGVVAQGSTGLTVNGAFLIQSLQLSPATIDLGDQVAFTLHFSGGTGTPSFSYLGEPPGCVLGSGTSYRCTPTVPGIFPISVQGVDALGAIANTSATLTVNVDPGIPYISATPYAVDLHQTFNITVVPAGGTAPYKFSYLGLPAACVGATNSSFLCTPTTVGSFLVTVTVTDHLGRHNTSTPLTLTVDPLPAVQSVVASPSSPQVNSAFTITVAASGGSKVYHYLYEGLPAGCSSQNLSHLRCTPTATGSFHILVNVTDSRGLSSVGGTWVNVTKASTSSSGFLGLSGDTGYYLIAGVAAAIVAVALALLLLRRRRAAGYAAEESPAEGEIPPEGEPPVEPEAPE